MEGLDCMGWARRGRQPVPLRQVPRWRGDVRLPPGHVRLPLGHQPVALRQLHVLLQLLRLSLLLPFEHRLPWFPANQVGEVLPQSEIWWLASQNDLQPVL